MARRKNIQNFFSPPKSNTAFTEGQKSKGILDDYAERKIVNTKEGTIDNTPTNPKDIVNKAYADSIVGGGGADNLGNHLATQTISGADIYMTNVISGAYLQGDGGGITGISVSGDDLGDHIATQTISGALIYGTSYNDGAIDHDALTNYAANEHFTEASIDHTAITNIGTKSHATLETDITGLSGATLLTTTERPGISGATLVNTSKISYTDAAQYQVTSGAQIVNTANIVTVSGAYYAHAADASDPHTATLTQTNIINTTFSGANILNTGDHNTSGAAFVVGVIMDPSATPPTASNFPQGTIYLQYTP